MTCSANADDGGRFVPVLVVAKQAWPHRPRTIEVPRGEYLSEALAIDAAHRRGVEWVRDYG